MKNMTRLGLLTGVIVLSTLVPAQSALAAIQQDCSTIAFQTCAYPGTINYCYDPIYECNYKCSCKPFGGVPRWVCSPDPAFPICE
jgi:hypothetical protein